MSMINNIIPVSIALPLCIIFIWLILDPWILNQEKDLLVFWRKWEQEKLLLKLPDLYLDTQYPVIPIICTLRLSK